MATGTEFAAILRDGRAQAGDLLTMTPVFVSRRLERLVEISDNVGLVFDADRDAHHVGAGPGLGFLIVEAQRTFRTPEMFAGIIVVALLGFLTTAALQLVERRLLAYRR